MSGSDSGTETDTDTNGSGSPSGSENSRRPGPPRRSLCAASSRCHCHRHYHFPSSGNISKVLVLNQTPVTKPCEQPVLDIDVDCISLTWWEFRFYREFLI